MSDQNAGLEHAPRPAGASSDANRGGAEAGNGLQATGQTKFGSSRGFATATIESLRNKVKSLEGQLAEQRNIQAGLDRTVSQKDAKIASLTEQMNRYKSIAESDTTALEEIRAERDALGARISELEGANTELESLKQAHNRLRLLMDKHPELAYLASNDAMPAAESDEEFIEKLDRIAGVAGSAAEGKAKQMLDGGRPPASPPGGQGGENPSALRREAFDLYEAGRPDEAQQKMDQYYRALEAARNQAKP